MTADRAIRYSALALFKAIFLALAFYVLTSWRELVTFAPPLGALVLAWFVCEFIAALAYPWWRPRLLRWTAVARTKRP